MTLHTAAERRRLVGLEMSYDEDPLLIPLAVGAGLVLGARCQDVDLDGFCLLRLRDVMEVEILNPYQQALLRDDGALESLSTVPLIDLSGWRGALDSLKRLGGYICLDDAWERENLAYGRIVRVAEDSVEMQYFGADCRWASGTLTIPFERITTAGMGTRYLEMFTKYLPEPPGLQ